MGPAAGAAQTQLGIPAGPFAHRPGDTRPPPMAARSHPSQPPPLGAPSAPAPFAPVVPSTTLEAVAAQLPVAAPSSAGLAPPPAVHGLDNSLGWTATSPPRLDLRTSLLRALRLRIDGEPSVAERVALEGAGLSDPLQRTFLCWRRSLLLVAMVALAPVVLVRMLEVLTADGMPGTLRALAMVPVVADAALGAMLWMQLRHWTSWQAQRRVILRWWLVSFAAPFVVYLYPLDRAAAEVVRTQLGAAAAGALGPVLGASYLAHAVLVLGPKVMALPLGMVRGALLTKLLLPGAGAPGWLLAVAAPVYALLAYLLLLVPYQLTGSGYFVLALAGLAGAQLVLARTGLQLARPSSSTEAQLAIARSRATYAAALGAGVLFLLVALARLSELLSMPALAVISTLLSLGANLLLATLVGTDLLIASLEPPRALGQEAQHAAAETPARVLALTRGGAPVSEASAVPPPDLQP